MNRPALLWLWPEFLDDFPELADLLRSFAELDSRAWSRAQLLDHIGDYDILVPRLEHEIDLALLDAAPRLAVIATPSTGTDHIAVAEAQRRGIRIVSIKDDREFLDTVQSTAELAWLLILACNRNLRACLKQVDDGGWERQAVRGHDLIGRTLGIVGYGRLGRMVSRFAHAFRMNVIAADPQRVSDDWVRQMPLAQLLTEADIITLHVHLTDQTRGMIGAEQFSQMKPGVFLVNTSRGDLIDEDAMVEALRSGRLGGAGLDVVCCERQADRAQRPLFGYAAEHDNLIITPHVGGCTLEGQHKATLFFAAKLKHACQQWNQNAV